MEIWRTSGRRSVEQEDTRSWGVYLVTLLGIGFSLTYAPLNWCRGVPEVAMANIVTGAVHALNLLWFRHAHQVALAAVVGLTAIVGFVLFASLSLGAQVYFWLFIIPPIAFFLLGAARGLWFLGATGAVIGGWTILHPPAWHGVLASLDVMPSFALVVGISLIYERIKTGYLDRLQELSSTDPLTGALNRRSAEPLLAREMRRSARYQRPLSLVLLDLDHFKAVNDQFGHNVGDLVLKEVAERVRRELRDTDALVRWGGEEFVIILPETPLRGASKVAERARAAVAAAPIPPVGSVTLSAGVAAQGVGEEPSALIERADVLLYQAKELGRNRVCHVASAA